MSEPRQQYQNLPLAMPLKWRAWILHIFTTSPSRIFDEAERRAFCDRYWAANPKLEAQQWRRAGQHAAKTGVAA
jgi:hypothetical protein